MKLELIPVIELMYFNEKVETPNGAYFEFPDEWDKAHKENFTLSGFTDEFKVCEPGMSLYRLNQISDNNLSKIIALYFEEFEEDEQITDDDIQPLAGGYILKINNQNKIFPQCCGDLGDYESWEGITDPNNEYFWNGHPTPLIKQVNENIVFDLSEMNNQKENSLAINREDLKLALVQTKKELNDFIERINLLKSNYEIKDLGDKLVFNPK